jgi:hypothetical protein
MGMASQLGGLEVYMKKIAFIGIVIFLVLFMVTCEEWFPDGEVEYTDVVYSKDGSMVTVYLDGVGVPLTKEQRAMSTDLATFAYDYLEAVFNGGASDIARASWELGMPAGISGVKRDINYAVGGSNPAVLMVGFKQDKTLLGVGKIGDVDRVYENTYIGIGTPWPGTPITTVGAGATSVTFWVEAIKTGLEADDDAAADAPEYSSFVDGSSVLFPSTRKAFSQSANAAKFPVYNITGPTVSAKYIFFGAANTLSSVLKAAAQPVAIRRMPRFLDGGTYRQPPKSIFDSLTTVTADNVTITGNLPNTIPLTFTVRGSGLLSFYVQLPVYAITNAVSNNDSNQKYVTWILRTGLGAELYSLDDGFASGGCVLINTGSVDGSDWLDIYWEWM